MNHSEGGSSKWCEDCTPRRVPELFATKWASMVLYTLNCGMARAGVLQRSLPGISKKMPTQTLRGMEASGLVGRHIRSTIPSMAEYRLTELEQRFVEPVDLLYGRGRNDADALDPLVPRPGLRQEWLILRPSVDRADGRIRRTASRPWVAGDASYRFCLIKVRPVAA